MGLTYLGGKLHAGRREEGFEATDPLSLSVNGCALGMALADLNG